MVTATDFPKDRAPDPDALRAPAPCDHHRDAVCSLCRNINSAPREQKWKERSQSAEAQRDRAADKSQNGARLLDAVKAWGIFDL